MGEYYILNTKNTTLIGGGYFIEGVNVNQRGSEICYLSLPKYGQPALTMPKLTKSSINYWINQ